MKMENRLFEIQFFNTTMEWYNRHIGSSVKKNLDINDKARITVGQNFVSVVVEAYGFENVSFIERDVRNHIIHARRLQLKEGNVMAIQVNFKKM